MRIEKRDFSFRKHNRIRKNSEFKNIYKKGRRLKNKYFRLYILNTSREYPRLGISVSRKIGNAVTRNKIKRILREIFRLNKDFWGKGKDIIIVAHLPIKELSFKRMNELLLDAFSKHYHQANKNL